MKKIIKLLFIIIVIIFISYLIKDYFNLKYGSDNNPILKTAESNRDDVIYFTKGMDKNDYLKAINFKPQKITTNKAYQNIVYDFDKVLSYEELENIYLKLNNSKMVNLDIIGHSIDNRNIYSLIIGQGEKIIMFEAGLHSSEIANPLFITKFVINLINDYENSNKTIKNILNNYKLIVLPVANPDGYDLAIKGSNIIKNRNTYLYQNKEQIDFNYNKANLNGVDLNRNMPSQNSGLNFKRYQLNSTVVLEPSSNKMAYFPGKSLGSEPETRALIFWQTKYYQEIFAYVTLHSSGRVIYNSKPNLSNELNKLANNCANLVNEITGYEVLGLDYEEIGQGNDGTTTDFMTELLSGYNFSEVTGRLSFKKYDQQINYLKHKACVINIETLESYTKDIDIIKKEYYNYNLEKAFMSLIANNN